MDVLPEEDLEERAKALRSELVPMAPGRAHTTMWAQSGENGQGFLPPGPRPKVRLTIGPVPLDDWVGRKGLKLGGGMSRDDAKSQYKALSRALFSDEKRHEDLKSLAVDFLRVNKSKLYESVTKEELAFNKKEGVRERLEKLHANESIGSVDFDGWCEALDYYYERGGVRTLEALSILMHAELRLVISEPIVAGTPERILCATMGPTKYTGLPPKCVVYLALERHCDGLHVASLEEDPENASAGEENMADDDAVSVAYTDASTRTDTALVEVTIAGDIFTLPDLLSPGGVSAGDGQHNFVAERTVGSQEVIVYKHDNRSGSQFEIKRLLLQRAAGPRKVKPPVARPSEPVERELVPIAANDAMQITQRIRQRGPEVTSDLAQSLLDALYDYIHRLNLTPSQNTSHEFYIDRLGAQMHDLVEKTKSIKLQMYEASSEAHTPFKVVVVGVEGAGKTTTVNQLVRTLTKLDATLGAANPVKKVTQSFSRRYTYEAPVDESIIDEAETAIYQAIQDSDNEFNVDFEQLNEQEDDILPTGSGCAITAKPTTLKFDPDTDEITLSVTYHDTAHVRPTRRNSSQPT